MRNGRLQCVEAIIERQQGVSTKRDDEELLFGRKHCGPWDFRPHRTVFRSGALPPLGDGLRIDAVALAQRLDRSLRSLYCRSDNVSGRGAAMQYLSHSVSLAVELILPP